MRRRIFNSKKIISGVMAVVMLSSLAGCGSKKSSETKADNSTNYEKTTIAPANKTDNSIRVREATADVEEWEGEYDCLDSGAYDEEYIDFNTNEFTNIDENSWSTVKDSPLSTFAADVDTAAYTTIRNMINSGYEVDSSAVRIEEMINYFDYDYELPREDEKFKVYTEYTDCPWNKDTKLAMVALNTMPIDMSDAPKQNLVFLIDTSGSMFDDNKLPLVQKSLCMLAENLTENDRVSIVTYAGSDTVVLEGVTGDNYMEISRAIENLEAHGSTNGSAGINTAYEIAEKYFIEGGNNRVILATDGDLNVGVTSEGELEKLITKKKETGVFLSVLGFGYGNYKDNKLETLADKGDGNYAYIDSEFEAKKALVDNMGSSLIAVAKDVKLQVEFNPELVKGYRLIGYENRVMAAQDFNDDKKDGGEMGAGHSVTALYEIVPSDSDFNLDDIELKYGNNKNEEVADEADSVEVTEEININYSDELFTVSIRYKEVDEDTSSKISFVCDKSKYNANGSDNIRWAAAVTEFGMLLMDSQYKGDTTAESIKELVSSTDHKNDAYKCEFEELINTYFSNH